jgi:hypothetical protein
MARRQKDTAAQPPTQEPATLEPAPTTDGPITGSHQLEQKGSWTLGTVPTNIPSERPPQSNEGGAEKEDKWMDSFMVWEAGLSRLNSLTSNGQSLSLLK